MSVTYQRPVVPRGALRLHFNENTGGCSPRVTEAIRAIREQDVSIYPEYMDAHASVAARLGAPPENVVLTNGMDEGILAAAVAQMRPFVSGELSGRAEVLIPTPAFEEYAAVASAVGARAVTVPSPGTLQLPVEALLARITPATRLVFLTSPGNPSGIPVPHDAVRAVSARLSPGAMLFLDEAYVEFTDDSGRTSFLGRLADAPNVVIGRTFSKAYGLAGLRLGALIGAPEVLGAIKQVVPPYSLNVFAASSIVAALEDTAAVERYQRAVAHSRTRLYEVCDRFGLPYWKSQANFVLIRAGERAARIASGLSARGVYVRLLAPIEDGDSDSACIRITAGVLAHTETCLTALEEVLCEGPR